MTLNSCLIIVAKVKQVFLYLPLLAKISFVSQSFLHQQTINRYFAYIFVDAKLK